MPDDTMHDPLDCRQFPSLNRNNREGYDVLETKMCENCDANFLRVVGSPVKYCRSCFAPASKPGKAYENFRASVATLPIRERRQVVVDAD